MEISLIQPWSSATVERGFSTLGRILTDARLSLTNKTLDDLMVLRVNLPVLEDLDPNYRQKMINTAIELYLTTVKRKRFAQ